MALHWSHTWPWLWKTSVYIQFVLKCDPNQKSAFGDYQCPLLSADEEDFINGVLCCAHVLVYLGLLRAPKYCGFNLPVLYYLLLFCYHSSGGYTPLYAPGTAYSLLTKATYWACIGYFLAWLTYSSKSDKHEACQIGTQTSSETQNSMDVVKYRCNYEGSPQQLAIGWNDDQQCSGPPASSQLSDTVDEMEACEIEQTPPAVPEGMAVRGRFSENKGFYEEVYDPASDTLDTCGGAPLKRFV